MNNILQCFILLGAAIGAFFLRLLLILDINPQKLRKKTATLFSATTFFVYNNYNNYIINNKSDKSKV
jgi:hypothetical protein